MAVYWIYPIMSIRDTLAVGYKRIDKENHISWVFYILYVGGLSFGWDAEGKAYTANGCKKATVEDIG